MTFLLLVHPVDRHGARASIRQLRDGDRPDADSLRRMSRRQRRCLPNLAVFPASSAADPHPAKPPSRRGRARCPL